MEQTQNTLSGGIVTDPPPYSISVSKTSTPGDDGDPNTVDTDYPAIEVKLPNTIDLRRFPNAALDFGSTGNPNNYLPMDFTVDGVSLVATFPNPNFGSNTWVDVYIKDTEGVEQDNYDYVFSIPKSALKTPGYTFNYDFDPAS